jgi:outer membrane biosynthesis protein TonB
MLEGTSRSLRRSGTVGTLAFACLALLAPGTAAAAAPSPDPPPLAVTRTVVTSPPAPVVTRTVVTPVIVTREVPARPAAAPATTAKATPKPKAKKKAAVAVKPKPAPTEEAAVRTLPPHDRHPVPLARFVPSAEELNRGLVALAGGGLGFVALGGAVLLLAARRQFGELAR